MGYLCRGYITRGLVWHEDRPPFVVGPGYVAAVEGEKRVSVLNGEEKSVRTPFVEVDRKVCRYVAEESDSCVRDMYSRLVVESGGAAALFPFKVLNSFTPKPGLPFEVAEKEANDDGRRLLNLLKAEVRQHVEESNKKAMEKVHFYLKAIDDQLEQCDERDRLIDRLSQPAVRLHY